MRKLCKTDEPIEMSFRGLSHVSPRSRILDGDQGRMNLFVAAGDDNSAMLPFAKLLWTLVVFSATNLRMSYHNQSISD